MTRRRPSRRNSFATTTLVLAVVTAGSPATTGDENGQFLLPSDRAPAALTALGNLEISRAMAVSWDGSRAAIGVPDPAKPKGGIVRVATTDPASPADVPIKGEVVALEFDLAGNYLYALGRRMGKREPVDAFVERIDLATMKGERVVTVPTSASGVDLWIHGSALLVACEDEIRTVTIPAGRSGPLYSVPGKNLAVTSLPGSDRVLVGQDEQLFLIDLSDPQGRAAMPIRATVDVPAPVVDLAAAPEGDAALMQIEGNRVFTVRLDPFGFDEERSAETILWLGERAAYVPPPQPVETEAAVEIEEPSEPVVVEASAPEPEAAVVPAPVPIEPEAPEPTVAEPSSAPEPMPVEPEREAAEPAPPPEQEPAATEALPPADPEPETPAAPESPAPESAIAEPPASAEPAPEPPSDTARMAATAAALLTEASTPAVSEKATPPPAPPETVEGSPRSADPERGEARGTLTGPAVAQVVYVVLLGPDSIVREAVRVSPEGDGGWEAGNLEPGRYRVVIDGGGDRVLQAQPAFRTIKVEAGKRIEVEPISILGTL